MNTLLQTSRARSIWPVLSEIASKGELITYKKLANAINIHVRPLRFALEVVQDKCRDLNLPPLTSLVVNAQTGVPGSGNSIQLEDFQNALKTIYGFDWKSKSNPFIVDEKDPTNTWWLNNENERYWMESTNRKDLGKDLIAPISSNAGQKLVSYVEDGDIIIHYDQNQGAIVAISMAKGAPFESETRWPDRKSSIRCPGYKVNLAFFTYLPSPITLESIHSLDSEIRKIREKLEPKLEGGPAYFPFQLPESKVIQPSQGMYLSKVPSELFNLFPQLEETIRNVWPLSIVSPEKPAIRIPPIGTSGKNTGQGRETNTERRLEVENYAMEKAEELLVSLGFSEVNDVSHKDGLGYDLEAIKGEVITGVEVKGSRSSVNSVDLQKSEVDFAQNALHLDLPTMLVVVDEILINEVSGQLKGSGGRIRYWSNWDAHETLLVPKSYNYKLPDEFLLG